MFDPPVEVRDEHNYPDNEPALVVGEDLKYIYTAKKKLFLVANNMLPQWHTTIRHLMQFLGPLDLLPWRVVGRSVGRSVCPSVNICNSATYVRIFFKIGVNIPWVNITRRFFHFCKILIFEFCIIVF